MKINIEGYEAMTTEQKLEALENYDPEANGYVSKADTAGYKKASRAAQDELKASQDAQKALEDRVKELETARKTAEVSAKFAPFGFAKEATEAFLNGDVEEFVKVVFFSISVEVDCPNPSGYLFSSAHDRFPLSVRQ